MPCSTTPTPPIAGLCRATRFGSWPRLRCCGQPTPSRSSVPGFPGEYVMISIARLLDALAYKVQEHVDLGYGVMSAATEIAEHVLAYVPRDGT